MKFPRDIGGQRFARLTVISLVGRAKNRQGLWQCMCDCGQKTIVTRGNLTSGGIRSCGCLKRDVPKKIIHGATRNRQITGLYSVWRTMRARCYSPSSISYPYYGFRGITVCDRWRFGESSKSGYECFLADMGPRPSPQHSIDRINNNGNYEPSNCRWATDAEQACNKRTNRFVVINGERMTLRQAISNFSRRSKGTVGSRLSRGWGLEKALFT